MKRTVRIEEAKYQSTTILLMVERYSSSNVYPTNIAYFDDSLNVIRVKNDVNSLPQPYVDAYMCGILGRSGSLSGNAFTQNFNSKVPEYDLSIYPVGTPIELEFDGYTLVTDTELVDTKKDVLQIVENANSVEELVDEIKEKFNLVEKSDDETVTTDAGKTPSSIRPMDLAGITALFSQYLTNPTYIKGDHVEFEIANPYDDFIDGTSDTSLMRQIRDFYDDWDYIKVSALPEGELVPKEVYPIADPNIFIKVGSNYVKAVPTDIDIYVNGNWYPLFGNGTTLPRIVILDDANNEVPLVMSKLRCRDVLGHLSTLANVKYRSRSTGAIGADLYYKDSSNTPKAIPNLSSTLAMFTYTTRNSSGTKFEFYFK